MTDSQSPRLRLLLPAAVFALLISALAVRPGTASAAGPELRTWTSKAGSKIEATLVAYDDESITLRFARGGERAIPIDQLSGDDVEYAQTFPKLKKESPPWLIMNAKTGSAARSRTFGVTTQRKALDIQVENKAKQPAPVSLIWIMLGEDFETKTEVVVDFGMWKGKLEAGEEKDLRTPETTTSFTEGGRYYSYYGGYYYYCSYYYPRGSEITSYVVQARWKDRVLQSTTGASSERIKTLAESEDLVEGLTEAGFKVDSELAAQIRKGLSSEPDAK